MAEHGKFDEVKDGVRSARFGDDGGDEFAGTFEVTHHKDPEKNKAKAEDKK